jgi:beta-galactosidase
MSVAASEQLTAISLGYDDSHWAAPSTSPRRFSEMGLEGEASDRVTVYRGTFDRPDLAEHAEARLLMRGHADALVYLNDTLCELDTEGSPERGMKLKLGSLLDVNNVIAIVEEESHPTGEQFDRSAPAAIKVREPARYWTRSLFNGLAQVIVQSTRDSGEVELVAEAPGLEKAVAIIATKR